MKLDLPSLFVNERVSLNIKLESHEKCTLASLSGAGCINHIWMTPGREYMSSRNAIIRIYFDGNDIPNVEAPVGDFFGIMHGEKFYPINTEYLVAMEESGYNAYFKMPFANGARIELEVGAESAMVFIMVDWHRYPENELKEEYRFCARWRNENPTERYGKDFLMVDADGPGELIGFVYGVRLHDNVDRWSHGGAENIYIDGEEKYPAYVRGIGGEDTFGTSYGGALHHPETTLYASMPYYTHADVGEARPAQRLTGYRFYIKDAIEFKKSLQMRFGCMQNEICSVVYWYSKAPVRDFYKMPSADALLPDMVSSGNDLELPNSGTWRICGPFPEGYDFDFLKFMGIPSNFKMDAEFPLNSEYTYGPDGRKTALWTEYKANHGFVDFRHNMRVRRRGPSQTEAAHAVAICALYAPVAGKATLNFTWDDDLQVLLNGKEIIHKEIHTFFCEKKIEVDLQKGLNTVELALGNTIGSNHGGWCFAFSCCMENGMRLYPQTYAIEGAES